MIWKNQIYLQHLDSQITVNFAIAISIISFAVNFFHETLYSCTSVIEEAKGKYSGKRTDGPTKFV